MKLTLTITGVFLIFALLTSCEAATENKDMPIEKEVTDFIDNFEAPESGDFINSSFDAFIIKYPAGHCDVWSNGMISFYYYDPDSPKEYGAVYLDSNGEKVELGCAVGITCIKSYPGKYVSENITPKEDTTPVETTILLDSPAHKYEFRDPIKLTAIVDPTSQGTEEPSGTVIFVDGDTSLGTDTLRYGLATITTSSLSVGSHFITAEYSGNSKFESSVSSDLKLEILEKSIVEDNNTTPDKQDTTPVSIWDNTIFSGIFIGVVVAFIVYILGWNQ